MLQSDSIVLTATGAAAARRVYVTGVTLVADSTGANVTIDDSTAGGGTEKLRLSCLNGETVIKTFESPLLCGTGCYATLSGTGASVTVDFI